jgi:membrane protein DedA with SNARE-associated domain
MDLMGGIVVWGGVAVASGIVGGLLAGVKNRDYSSWIAWCFVLPPLIFVLLLLPRYQGLRPRQPRLDEGEERGF